jgi:hypothetical protein
VSVIDLALKLVLQAGSSLRGAVAALALLVRQGLAWFRVPCFSAIRSWLLRLGYHALTRSLDRSRPWVWLVDHTIQLGNQKILVILGCPLDQVPFGQRALQLADLSLVALVPMDKSTGAVVETELEQAQQRTGTPQLIVSDQGSDVRKGINDFQSWYPRTAYVPDIAHFGATLLEHAWRDYPPWQQFLQKLQATSSKLQQSRAAYLLAPRQRHKARFMNVGAQLRFARRVLKLVNSATPHAPALEHYGWLKDHEEDLRDWEREHGLVQKTIELLRVDGLHAGTLPLLEKTWEQTYGALGTRCNTVRIAAGLRDYVKTHQPTKAGERLVASTEILESSFGKLKRIERDQSQDGLTGLALALGAMVGARDQDELKEALDATPQKKVNNWATRVFGKTMQWYRRIFLGKKSEPNPG